jgi:hypothetical protein
MRFIYFVSVSDDFPSNFFTEMSCQSANHQSSNLYTIDLVDRMRTHYYICDVSTLFGFVMIHNRNDFSSDTFLNVYKSQSENIVLKPKIITTDENLRIFSPQKYKNLKTTTSFTNSFDF